MLDQSMNWKDAEYCVKKWGGPFALKGVMSVEDAKRAIDIEFDVDKVPSMQQSGSDDTDVVFGSDIIRVPSMEKFVLQYPESALKFLMRQNIDGKPLPSDIVLVHAGWEERGLSRNVLKKYVLELMQWSDFPDLPFQDFYLQIRNRIFEVSRS